MTGASRIASYPDRPWRPFSLLDALAFALARTRCERASLNLFEVFLRHSKSFLTLATQKVWMLGPVARIGGVRLQGAGLNRVRLSIVQPLLVTTVDFAIPLGYFLTGRRSLVNIVPT